MYNFLLPQKQLREVAQFCICHSFRKGWAWQTRKWLAHQFFLKCNISPHHRFFLRTQFLRIFSPATSASKHPFSCLLFHVRTIFRPGNPRSVINPIVVKLLYFHARPQIHPTAKKKEGEGLRLWHSNNGPWFSICSQVGDFFCGGAGLFKIYFSKPIIPRFCDSIDALLLLLLGTIHRTLAR